VAIHPSAIIDPNAELDSSVEVGPFCVIEENVRVGAGTRLYQGVYLTGWTDIGQDCDLHPGAIVGHVPQDTKYYGARTYCRVGRGTILREYVTVHRGTTPESTTVIGEDCFLLGGCHVAHNCSVGDRVTLINNVLLGGHVTVGDRATLGGGAIVHQFVRIGELAMVAGGARIVQDILPFALTNVEGRVAGLNRVGLRRAGMSREDIEAIRDAYRIVFERGLSGAEACERLADEPQCGARDELLRFVREGSRRGLAGRSRPGPGIAGKPAEVEE